MIEQTGPYIPRNDAALQQWMTNFSDIVAMDPAAAGLTQADSDVLSGFAVQFQQALAKAVSPLTRTPQVVNDKDNIRNQARDTFRIYAIQIKANDGVDNSLKLSLGIHLNDTTPTPIPAPVTFPVLTIAGTEPGSHILRYTDSATPDSKAKPVGAAQLWLYSFIGDAPITDYEQASLIGAFTRVPITVSYNPVDAGKTVTYWARWVTQRGLMGPWSLPVAMQVAFGGPVEQAAVPGGGTPMGGQTLGGDEELKIAA